MTVTKSLEEEKENVRREKALHLQMLDEVQMAKTALDGLQSQIKELARQQTIETAKNTQLKQSNESEFEAAKKKIGPMREAVKLLVSEIEKGNEHLRNVQGELNGARDQERKIGRAHV